MKQRILTAVIALIVFVPLVLIGSWPFTVVAYLVATIALYELLRMNVAVKVKTSFIIAMIFLWLLIFPTPEISFGSVLITKYDILITYLVVLLLSIVISKNKITFDQVGFIFVATLYIGIAFYLISVTRQTGLNYLLFILFTIWATDSGAYFMGKFFGKRKLWPAISPNKTIGGALGGFLLAVITGIVFQLIYPFELPFHTIVAVSAVISIFGQLGDLVASAIKRYYQVKDSGSIFPGHGGIIDRFDSLLFVVIILHLIKFI